MGGEAIVGMLVNRFFPSPESKLNAAVQALDIYRNMYPDQAITDQQVLGKMNEALSSVAGFGLPKIGANQPEAGPKFSSPPPNPLGPQGENFTAGSLTETTPDVPYRTTPYSAVPDSQLRPGQDSPYTEALLKSGRLPQKGDVLPVLPPRQGMAIVDRSGAVKTVDVPKGYTPHFLQDQGIQGLQIGKVGGKRAFVAYDRDKGTMVPVVGADPGDENLTEMDWIERAATGDPKAQKVAEEMRKYRRAQTEGKWFTSAETGESQTFPPDKTVPKGFFPTGQRAEKPEMTTGQALLRIRRAEEAKARIGKTNIVDQLLAQAYPELKEGQPLDEETKKNIMSAADEEISYYKQFAPGGVAGKKKEQGTSKQGVTGTEGGGPKKSGPSREELEAEARRRGLIK